MATTWIKPLHVNKGKTIAQTLKERLDYAENPNKTEVGEWVTSYECDPLIADDEFLFSKNQYATITGREQGTRDVLAYHLRISFKPGETDAQTANKIGYDLALKLTKGNHAFVCCTHTDKHHIHSHVFINSTSLDCTKKFRNFKGSSFAIRRMADYLCLENGLSIVENPNPSRGSYANWQGDTKPPSNREQLQQIIDAALENCKDYEAFIAAMIAAGCEVKQGKHLAIKIPGAERFARLKSLGADYSEKAIRDRISCIRIVAPKPKIIIPPPSNYKPSLLIDIQAKIQQGYDEGFAHWARLVNLKEASRTLIFLQERGLLDYSLLTKAASESSKIFNARSARSKDIAARQKEISELQKNIGTYSKTKNILAEYNRLKKLKPTAIAKLIKAESAADKFYRENESEIIRCNAAKKYFDEQGYGQNKKLPAMATLKEEYTTLSAELKNLNFKYKDERDEMIAIKIAKQNVDYILGEPRQPTKTHERDAR